MTRLGMSSIQPASALPVIPELEARFRAWQLDMLVREAFARKDRERALAAELAGLDGAGEPNCCAACERPLLARERVAITPYGVFHAGCR